MQDSVFRPSREKTHDTSPHQTNHLSTWLGWCLAFVLLLPIGYAQADEGMHLLYETNKLPWKSLKARGLKLSGKQLRALAPAIVQLARGGTGSFVSARGLIVTNHHVAYSCLAYLNATTHKGLLKKGHVANNLSQEIPCPGYDMKVVIRVQDITAKVRKAIKPNMTPKQRFLAVMVQKRKLEASCETTKGLLCQVRALNGGAAYTLSVYKRLKDVRLVYAPPGALGKYGGDIDNWRYPRHTADFTFLRAYVSPKGKGISHKKTNVPFHPKRFLKLSIKGIKRNDLTMVLGFPGRTSRHTTLYAALYRRDHGMKKLSNWLDLLLNALPKKGLSGRRYRGLRAGLANGSKYYKDLQKQFRRFKLIALKRKQLAAVKAKIAASANLRKRYGKLLPHMKAIYATFTTFDEKSIALRLTRIARSLRVATDIARWSRIRKIPDLLRESSRYRNKNMYRVYRGSRMLERMTTPEGEKRLVLAVFRRALALPAKHRPRSAVWLNNWGKTQHDALKKQAKASKKSYADVYKASTAGAKASHDPLQVAVDRLYASTQLYPQTTTAKAAAKAKAHRAKLFKASEETLRKSKDPMLKLAFQIASESKALRDGPLVPLRKILDPILVPRYIKHVLRPSYWDANFTLRINFGQVRDYTSSKTKKRHLYVSSLAQLLKKDKGKKPFNVPARLKAIAKKKDLGRWTDKVLKDLPINFTTTLDTTGGNSGSPVLNGKGELVGLLFDGTPEAILSDWLYTSAQRSICMDIRYALFLAEKFSNATSLLGELGL